MVSTISIAIMIFDMIVGIVLPTILTIYFLKRYHLRIRPFLTGAAVFILFAAIIEKLFHTAVFSTDFGAAIQGNVYYYALYGGLMAGLFEETGRFTAMKFYLKQERQDDHNAIAYGIGHGGIELMIILVIGMLNNIIYSVMINNGTISTITSTLSGNLLNQMESAITTLIETKPITFLVAFAERIIAITLQISLSVIVWYAVKKGGKGILFFPLAILIHAGVDAVAVILMKGYGVWAAEGASLAMTIATVAIATNLWKRMKNLQVFTRNATLYV